MQAHDPAFQALLDVLLFKPEYAPLEGVRSKGFEYIFDRGFLEGILNDSDVNKLYKNYLNVVRAYLQCDLLTALEEIRSAIKERARYHVEIAEVDKHGLKTFLSPPQIQEISKIAFEETGIYPNEKDYIIVFGYSLSDCLNIKQVERLHNRTDSDQYIVDAKLLHMLGSSELQLYVPCNSDDPDTHLINSIL